MARLVLVAREVQFARAASALGDERLQAGLPAGRAAQGALKVSQRRPRSLRCLRNALRFASISGYSDEVDCRCALGVRVQRHAVIS